MSGPEQSLQAGETVALRLRPHAILYLRSMIWAVLAAALAAAALFSRDPRFWGLASLLTAGAAVAAALQTMFLRRTMAFAVTDRRVLLTNGVFRRRLAEAFPAAIPGFELSQGLLGRICGYASVRIRGLGQGPWLVLPEPERLRNSLEALALGGVAVPEVAVPTTEPKARPAPAAPQPEPVERAPCEIDGDARPLPNGSGAVPLRPQADLDRF